MSDKIARLGIERDNDLMYYIKNGDVWATPRKQKGQPKGKAQKIAATGIELDYSKFIYFLDGDGDVARKARAVGGGGGRAKAKAKAKAKPNGNGTKTTRSAISGHFVTEATAKRHPKTTVTETVRGRKKSEAQLDREIEECLAQTKSGGNGNGVNGTKAGGNGNGNGTKAAGQPAGKKKTSKKSKKTKKKRG